MPRFIDKDRICSKCGLKTYTSKNGYTQWYLHDGKYYCNTCHHRIFPEGNRKNKYDARLRLLGLLGGKCSNPKCLVPGGCADIRCLHLDHINGGGFHERRTRFRTTTVMVYYYLKHPDEAKKNIQVLCANCNCIKVFENKEHPKTPKKFI